MIYHPQSIHSLKNNLKVECSEIKKIISQSAKQLTVKVVQPRYGTLVLSTYMAKGEVTFKIEISNQTDRSIHLDAIYFYTGLGWAFTQDGAQCPYRIEKVDQHPMTNHFLKPPLQRLAPNAWTRVTIEGRKTLATRFNGEDLKRDYRLKGVALLRLQTDSGIEETKENIDIPFDEIPF